MESRNHSALMSPVTTKVWGPFHCEPALLALREGCAEVPSVCHLMVVSRVLGKAFLNNWARSLSSIRDVISSMTCSTAGELKVRHSCAGRWKGRFKGPPLYGGLRGRGT